jgi:aspartate dehydrogenase
MKKIGLIGFGRIGSYLFERISENQNLEIRFVYEPDMGKTSGLDKSIVLNDIDEIFNMKVDLVIEAADFRAVKEYAPEILRTNDMMILSATALADEKLSREVLTISNESKTRICIPHGALLGMDGIFDAKESLSDVTIVTIKNPRNIDFDFTNDFKREEITERTVLYDGYAREICSKYPRNVNSHAVVAIAGIGFERTHSILVADPNSDDAFQHVTAEGGGTLLEIKRSSAIKGVTGEYTLLSLYGSVVRALENTPGITIV